MFSATASMCLLMAYSFKILIPIDGTVDLLSKNRICFPCLVRTSGLRDLLPEKTVIVTNSSTLLPSKLAKSTGRENKFLALHFANSIWKNNIAEVMGHDKTDEKYFNEIISFAEAINMIPLAAREEKSGYLLNSMLVPFLLSAMDLLANGVSDAITIDKAWTLGTGAPKGPFHITSSSS